MLHRICIVFLLITIQINSMNSEELNSENIGDFSRMFHEYEKNRHYKKSKFYPTIPLSQIGSEESGYDTPIENTPKKNHKKGGNTPYGKTSNFYIGHQAVAPPNKQKSSSDDNYFQTKEEEANYNAKMQQERIALDTLNKNISRKQCIKLCTILFFLTRKEIQNQLTYYYNFLSKEYNDSKLPVKNLILNLEDTIKDNLHENKTIKLLEENNNPAYFLGTVLKNKIDEDLDKFATDNKNSNSSFFKKVIDFFSTEKRSMSDEIKESILKIYNKYQNLAVLRENQVSEESLNLFLCRLNRVSVDLYNLTPDINCFEEFQKEENFLYKKKLKGKSCQKVKNYTFSSEENLAGIGTYNYQESDLPSQKPILYKLLSMAKSSSHASLLKSSWLTKCATNFINETNERKKAFDLFKESSSSLNITDYTLMRLFVEKNENRNEFHKWLKTNMNKLLADEFNSSKIFYSHIDGCSSLNTFFLRASLFSRRIIASLLEPFWTLGALTIFSPGEQSMYRKIITTKEKAHEWSCFAQYMHDEALDIINPWIRRKKIAAYTVATVFSLYAIKKIKPFKFINFCIHEAKSGSIKKRFCSIINFFKRKKVL